MRILFIASACVLSLAAGSAAAQSTPVPGVLVSAPDYRVVSYADLNLDSEAGQEVLSRRIRNAAEEVCPDVGRLLVMAAYRRECLRTAIEGGEVQVAALVPHTQYAEASRTIRVSAPGGNR